ncbi:MAG: hypothetical protein KGQ59_11655, partial [Bdellovibrionales bacterium]|nr:hypothetical protein [Bdellovibrionales bacterium]
MTRVFINLGMLAASAVMISACSTGKHCADGVCRTVKDGKTTYEGDPEKIARIKAEENKQSEWIDTIKKKIAQAPRKPAGEKIRIVVAPGNISKEMGPYAAQYISLLEQKLKSYEGLELLNEGQMRRDLNNRAVFMALSNPKAFG